MNDNSDPPGTEDPMPRVARLSQKVVLKVVRLFHCFALAGSLAALAASQPSYQLIYPSVGDTLKILPVFGPDGKLYAGDSNGDQTLQLAPPAHPRGAWTITNTGVPALAPYLLGSNGQFFGAGSVQCSPTGSECGTVFTLIPPSAPGGAWTTNTLYTFPGPPNSWGPLNAMVIGADGSIYGVANGGQFDQGAVFRLSPPAVSGGPWTESVLYSFAGPPNDGAYPNGVVLSSDGTLYGTALGGAECPGSTCGVVFKLAPPATPEASWAETILYAFANGKQGYYPIYPVLGPNGELYAVTAFGGHSKGDRPGAGTAFELTPPSVPGGAWSMNTLFEFGTRSGAHPSGLAMGQDGNLYGTAESGGVPCGKHKKAACGTIFELSPPSASGQKWTETVLHAFRNNGDGTNPTGGLTIGSDGTLYGVTAKGGSNNGGVVFLLKP
jgi:uncharacterized repeat protein (TIGR03803 family)